MALIFINAKYAAFSRQDSSNDPRLLDQMNIMTATISAVITFNLTTSSLMTTFDNDDD